MNDQEATAFIEKAFKIWINGNADQLSSIYDSTIDANYFGHANLGFADIENRFNFVRKNHRNIAFKLHDLVVSGNKIAFRSGYSAQTIEGEPVYTETMAIFHLNAKGRVQKIWSMTNAAVDFLAKA